MKLPGHEDPTRQHARVTAGLVAAAALVLVVLDDPSQRTPPVRVDAAASTAVAAGVRRLPPGRAAPYRQFDASAQLVSGPVAVRGTTPMLPRKK